MELTMLESRGGASVPLMVTRPEAPRALLLLLPALGIPARFYRRLAAGLAEENVTVAVLEQRGNGESPYRPGDGSQFGLKDYLDDIAAATDWLKADDPDMPLYIGGHSLGGHMATLAVAAAPADYAGVVHLACGFPYYGDYPYPARGMVRTMIALIPLATRLLGYFPGTWFGFGDREYGGLMRDWRHWARDGRYDIPGFDGSEAALADYPGRVVSIAFERDRMATDAAVERSRAVYAAADMARFKLGSKEQGTHLGHIDWAKAPAGTIAALADWFGAV